MGAGSSHPVPVKPIIDYRLFYSLPARKNRDGYEIAAAIPREGFSAYQALVTPKFSKADVELSYAAFPETQLGSVKFFQEGGERSRIEITVGDDGDSEEMERMKRKTFAVSYGKAEYVWKVTGAGFFGGIKEMILKVRVEEDGKEVEDGEGKTEEETGEIVAIWKTKSIFTSFETGFWIKKNSMGEEDAKRWEAYVLLTGLAVLVGSQRK